MDATVSESTETLLDRLAHVREASPGRWTARCPAHEDRRASLSIRHAADGRVLIHCFAGCTFVEIVFALGLEPRDLAPPGRPAQGHRPPRPRLLLEEPKARVLARERQCAQRRAIWTPWWMVKDYLRTCDTAAREARTVANQLGEDHPRIWPLLEETAQFEREALRLEAYVDAVMLRPGQFCPVRRTGRRP